MAAGKWTSQHKIIVPQLCWKVRNTMSMKRMLASVTSNSGAVVKKTKKNIKTKKHKPLKLKANTTYCRFQANSSSANIHIQGDPDQDVLSGLYPSTMHRESRKNISK